MDELGREYKPEMGPISVDVHGRLLFPRNGEVVEKRPVLKRAFDDDETTDARGIIRGIIFFYSPRWEKATDTFTTHPDTPDSFRS